MKILLTGGTGFVGSHTAQELTGRGHEVHALVRNPSKAEFLKNLGVHLIQGDLAGLESCQEKWPVFDAVIHIAGLIKAKCIKDFYSVNVEGTRFLLEKIKTQRLKKFIFISSIAARGPNKNRQDDEGIGPVCHYGKSKLEAEEVVLNYRISFPVVLVRPPVVYGPGDRETLTLFKMFRKGFFPAIGREKRKISFVYVLDLASTLAVLVEQSESPRTYIRGDSPSPEGVEGEAPSGFAGGGGDASPYNSQDPGPFYPEDGAGGHDWDEVIRLGEDLYKKRIRQMTIPVWMGQLIAGGAEAGGRILNKTVLFNRDKFQEIKHPFWFCSSESLRKACQLSSPTNLNKGFTITKKWYEDEGWM